MARENFTTQQVADLFGTQTWRVRRLFQVGRLPEPPRFAGKRAIPRAMLAEIGAALHERGWAPSVAAASSLATDSGEGSR